MRRVVDIVSRASGMIGDQVVRVLLSIVTLVLLAVHLFVPGNRVDLVAIVLLVLLILPWLHGIIESLEVSATGAKVKYRDLKSATSLVTAEAGRAEVDAPTNETSQPELDRGWREPDDAIATVDPDLALVALRIEIERRIVRLADEVGLQTRPRNLSRLVTSLAAMGVLTSSEADGLDQLIQAGNAAAHGARVEHGVIELAGSIGPDVLSVIDDKLKRYNFEAKVMSAIEASLPARWALERAGGPGDAVDGIAVGPNLRWAIEVKSGIRADRIGSIVELAARSLRKGFERYLLVVNEDDGAAMLAEMRARLAELDLTSPRVVVMGWRVADGEDAFRRLFKQPAS